MRIEEGEVVEDVVGVGKVEMEVGRQVQMRVGRDTRWEGKNIIRERKMNENYVSYLHDATPGHRFPFHPFSHPFSIQQASQGPQFGQACSS